MQTDGSVIYREADGTEHRFAANADGTFASPTGKFLTLTREVSGWTMRSKDGFQVGFNALGLLITQMDLNGNRVTVQRDTDGTPTNVLDATGRSVLAFTVTNGKIANITDVGGRTVVYGYTGDDLTSVTDTAGKVWTMAYDLGHNMTAFADPLGNTQGYDYDADDRLMQHVDAVGAEELFHYDIAGRQGVLTDKRGGDRFLQYDDLGRGTTDGSRPCRQCRRASFNANNSVGFIDSRGQRLPTNTTPPATSPSRLIPTRGSQ